MADLIQLRRDTKANWDAVSGSVILADGEVGIICDQSPLQCKVGDGVSYWNQLETQAWIGTGSLDQVSSSINELSGSLEEELSRLEANVSYVVCPTPGSIVTKDISVPDFELSTHCRLMVKMEHAHTSSTAPTLRINLQNGTEKPLYYNGIVASSTNNWNDNEILDIYYDETNYQSISIKDKTLYSLVESVNVGSQNSATNAFNSVPSNLRKLGLKVTWYDTINTKWVTKQYIGSDLSGWNTESNWNNIDTFKTGQKINDVSIDSSELKSPDVNSLAKAIDVMPLAASLDGIDVTVRHHVLHTSGTSQNVFEGFVKVAGLSGVVPFIGKDVAGYLYTIVDVEGFSRVSFIGIKYNISTAYIGWAFYDASNYSNGAFLEDNTGAISWGRYEYDTSLTVSQQKIYTVEIPAGAKYLKVGCKLGNSTIVNTDTFALYLEKGLTVKDEIRESFRKYNYIDFYDNTQVGYLKTDGTVSTQYGGLIKKFKIPQGVDKVKFFGCGNFSPNTGWAAYWLVDGNGDFISSSPEITTTLQEFNGVEISVNNTVAEIWSSFQVKWNGITLHLEYDTQTKEYLNINEINYKVDKGLSNHWYGKRILWLGTSIPDGQGGNGIVASRYPNQVCSALGAELISSTKRGLAQMASYDSSRNMWYPKNGGSTCLTVDECVAAYQAGLVSSDLSAYSYENTLLGKNADLYVFDVEPNNISTGSDDVLALFNWHEWKYNDNSSFASHRDTYVGALIYEIDALLNDKPDAVIVMIGEFINLTNDDEYAVRQSTIAFCNKFKIGYINIAAKLGYNGKNKSQWVNDDNVHPKQAAYDRIAKMLIHELLLIA